MLLHELERKIERLEEKADATADKGRRDDLLGLITILKRKADALRRPH